MLVAPFAGSQAVAQTHNLTGTVVDAQGNPVAGAAVVIDGTTKGTSTGSDGSFALNGVMANQSLLVTFIGYEPQTVAIGSQTNMKVVLKEDNQTLDEVVVIGYGVQKKRDVTGSITSVKSDVFESRSVENAQQALQGKARACRCSPLRPLRVRVPRSVSADSARTIRAHRSPSMWWTA